MPRRPTILRASERRPFGKHWLDAIGAAERTLSGPPSHRTLDAFLPVRDHAFELAKDGRVVAALEQAWLELKRIPGKEPLADLMLHEIQALRHAAELAPAEEGGRERVAGYAHIVMGSAKEAFEDLLKRNPLVKAAVMALDEVFELFSAK